MKNIYKSLTTITCSIGVLFFTCGSLWPAQRYGDTDFKGGRRVTKPYKPQKQKKTPLEKNTFGEDFNREWFGDYDVRILFFPKDSSERCSVAYSIEENPRHHNLSREIENIAFWDDKLPRSCDTTTNICLRIMGLGPKHTFTHEYWNPITQEILAEFKAKPGVVIWTQLDQERFRRYYRDKRWEKLFFMIKGKDILVGTKEPKTFCSIM